MSDLASRLELPESTVPWDQKPQVSTDGFNAYPAAVQDALGYRVNYGQIIKNFADSEQPGRYGPPDVVSTDRRRVYGVDNLWTICTSHVERCNLTIRTFMKRFTRLSLGFSKKQENLAAAIALHVAHYNYCWRPREKGSKGRLHPTPAMMAGVIDKLWKIDDLYDAVVA